MKKWKGPRPDIVLGSGDDGQKKGKKMKTKRRGNGEGKWNVQKDGTQKKMKMRRKGIRQDIVIGGGGDYGQKKGKKMNRREKGKGK